MTARRRLSDHKVNPANDSLEIEVTDEPGAGGANHQYEVYGFKPAKTAVTGYDAGHRAVILFQNGPIPEAGVNGITQEVLLAILVDRLKSFQAGPYACRENAIALTHMQEAQNWLNRRTLERMRRGVEGTHEK